jgi:hypothetical protein
MLLCVSSAGLIALACELAITMVQQHLQGVSLGVIQILEIFTSVLSYVELRRNPSATSSPTISIRRFARNERVTCSCQRKTLLTFSQPIFLTTLHQNATSMDAIRNSIFHRRRLLVIACPKPVIISVQSKPLIHSYLTLCLRIHHG